MKYLYHFGILFLIFLPVVVSGCDSQWECEKCTGSGCVFYVQEKGYQCLTKSDKYGPWTLIKITSASRCRLVEGLKKITTTPPSTSITENDGKLNLDTPISTIYPLPVPSPKLIPTPPTPSPIPRASSPKPLPTPATPGPRPEPSSPPPPKTFSNPAPLTPQPPSTPSPNPLQTPATPKPIPQPSSTPWPKPLQAPAMPKPIPEPASTPFSIPLPTLAKPSLIPQPSPASPPPKILNTTPIHPMSKPAPEVDGEDKKQEFLLHLCGTNVHFNEWRNLKRGRDPNSPELLQKRIDKCVKLLS